MSSRSLALPLLALLVGCGSSTDSSDSGSADITQGGPDLVFAGGKAPQGGNASAPSGDLHSKKAGDTVVISYAPQRVRGCDGGGWAQDTTVKFLDRNGRELGQGANGSGFGGTGMVPRSKPALTLSATIPAGAVKLTLLTQNDGGPHRASDSADTPHSGDNKGSDSLCSDTIDGRGWQIDIGGSGSGTTAPPPPPPPATHTLVPGIYQATDTQSEGAELTLRRADAHNLRYDLTLRDAGSPDQTVLNMWASDDGFGNGQFVTPAIRDNDCEFSLTVTDGTIKLNQGQSTCASQGFAPHVVANGTYKLTTPGAPPSDVAPWTGSFVEPSPGTVELDISVQTAPAPGSSAFNFAFAYQLKPGGAALNGIAKVTDQNQPATAAVSGCALTFDKLLDRVTVSADAKRPECTTLGFVDEDNTFEILAPKAP